MSILNILANNGGKRQGGTVRILRSKNGGAVRIISIRRIPFGKRHKNGGIIMKKLVSQTDQNQSISKKF